MISIPTGIELYFGFEPFWFYITFAICLYATTFLFAYRLTGVSVVSFFAGSIPIFLGTAIGLFPLYFLPVTFLITGLLIIINHRQLIPRLRDYLWSFIKRGWSSQEDDRGMGK